jgi:hypothetical protein
MLRKEIHDRFRYETLPYGRGYRYCVHVFASGEKEWRVGYGSISEAKKVAEEGDAVRIEVLPTSEYAERIDTLDFSVRPLSEGERMELEGARDAERRRRDYQRSEVYALEREYESRLQTDRVRWEEAAGLLAEVFADFGLAGEEPPMALARSSAKRSTFYHRYEIVMATTRVGGYVRDRSLLHEAAHALCFRCLEDGRNEGHGPRFTALVGALYALYLPEKPPNLRAGVVSDLKGADRSAKEAPKHGYEEFVALALERGVDIDPDFPFRHTHQ